MVIFDDYEYVKLLMAGKAPKCIYRNNVLRSCARLIARGDYEPDDVRNALNEYMSFDVTDEDLNEYVETRTILPPVSPHLVVFGLGEIKCVNMLPRKSDRKLYLYQLFCFKYFGVKKLRLAHREFKRLAGLDPNHFPTKNMHIGHGISIRREKNGKILKSYSTNKPYTYYYPTVKAGKPVFSYLYEGDCFMLPSVPFESNLSELWAKYLQAEKEWL